MKRVVFVVYLSMAACGALTACASGTSDPTGDPCAGKNATQAPPYAAFLDFPASGSSGVQTNVGMIIEKGANEPGTPAVTLVVASAAGTVPLGAPMAAPSPLPSPFVAAPPQYSGPYVAIPLPTLQPNTSYSVYDTYLGFADTPPSCTAVITQFSGTFTTGP